VMSDAGSVHFRANGLFAVLRRATPVARERAPSPQKSPAESDDELIAG
jgi:hypothetical protein